MRELLSSVVAADNRRRGGRTLSRRDCAAGKPRESAGGHPARKFSVCAGAAQIATPRAARSLECARTTDKALGESQLSRPMARAATTVFKIYRYGTF